MTFDPWITYSGQQYVGLEHWVITPEKATWDDSPRILWGFISSISIPSYTVIRCQQDPYIVQRRMGIL
jgi:predicted transcriptional regulator